MPGGKFTKKTVRLKRRQKLLKKDTVLGRSVLDRFGLDWLAMGLYKVSILNGDPIAFAIDGVKMIRKLEAKAIQVDMEPKSHPSDAKAKQVDTKTKSNPSHAKAKQVDTKPKSNPSDAKAKQIDTKPKSNLSAFPVDGGGAKSHKTMKSRHDRRRQQHFQIHQQLQDQHAQLVWQQHMLDYQQRLLCYQQQQLLCRPPPGL